MTFNLAEKLAIVRVIDSVIVADSVIHSGEISALSQLMHKLDFDSNFLIQCRNLELQQGILIMKSMSLDKKKKIKQILEDVAISDGYVHLKEKDLLLKVYSQIDLVL